jgi:hypothetical protein
MLVVSVSRYLLPNPTIFLWYSPVTLGSVIINKKSVISLNFRSIGKTVPPVIVFKYSFLLNRAFWEPAPLRYSHTTIGTV